MHHITRGNDGVGIYDDAIQFEAWFEEVWSEGSDRIGEGTYAAPHYGYLDAAGGQQDIQRATNARTLITHVPQGKACGRYQGLSVHKWSAAACIHPQGRRGVANSINRIHIRKCNNSRRGEEAGAMLRRALRICQHGDRRGCNHGFKRGSGRHDGADST